MTRPDDSPTMRIAPPVFLREAALRRLFGVLRDARVVGGAVRDALAGRPIADIDLATPSDPGAVTAALGRAGIRVVPTGIAHGTVTAVLDGTSIEITTLRRDVAADGRHATVAFTADWRADAARRDFTINAMSMTPDGAVYDYFGGVADLRAGLVRFVGAPAQRMMEDYLRVLRYFRFFARYGTAPPDAALRTAIRAALPGVTRLSGERVWGELLRILAAPDPRAAIMLMAELGVLATILPEGAEPARLGRLVAADAPADPLLRAAALLGGDVRRCAERLHLSGAERDWLISVHAAPLARPEDDDAALRRLLADHDRASLIGRTWLDGTADAPWPGLRARLAALAQPVFPLEGRDVVALGVPPGPRVGRVLRTVRDWWRAGGCMAPAEACREVLRRVLRGDTTAAKTENPASSPRSMR